MRVSFFAPKLVHPIFIISRKTARSREPGARLIELPFSAGRGPWTVECEPGVRNFTGHGM